MKGLSIRLAVLLGSLAIARAASAQVQMPMQGQGLNAALMKLFGDTKAFSARTEFLIRSGAETTIIPMGFALLDGKMRMDVDMAQVKSKQMPAKTLAMLKKMGMDRMVNIIIPEKKIMWIIYPALKAYAEMPAMDEAVAGFATRIELELGAGAGGIQPATHRPTRREQRGEHRSPRGSRRTSRQRGSGPDGPRRISLILCIS
jgi:hypothetical protein